MYAELKRKICNECKTEKSFNEFPKFRKNQKEYARSYCFSCRSFAQFKTDLWKLYRIRFETFKKMHDDQNGCCACCGAHESQFKRRLHVDHCHETGEIRGLLCTQCNPGIGYFNHSIERIEMAAAYLKKFKK